MNAPVGDEAAPLVSICIPSYKGEAFIGDTIRSVLAQSYGRFELLVVDDASPDRTEAVVEGFDDPRVRYLRNATNLGPEGNWNRCLEVASGTYYKLLPQDDLLVPGALAEQVTILEADARQEIALVFGSRRVIDHHGRYRLTRGLPRTGAGRIAGQELIRRCVRAGTNLVGEPGNGLIRRTLTERIGPYDARHPYLVDLDYWFRVLTTGDAWYTGKPSSCFRISMSSWSFALRKKQLDDFKGFVDKFAVDPALRISGADRAIGFHKASINTMGRALIYQAMFREGR